MGKKHRRLTEIISNETLVYGSALWGVLYGIFFGAWASFAGVNDGICIAMGVLSVISAVGSMVFSGFLIYGTREIPMVLLSLVETALATTLLVRGYIYIPNDRSGIIVTGYYVGGHTVFLALTALFLLIVVPYQHSLKKRAKLLEDFN